MKPFYTRLNKDGNPRYMFEVECKEDECGAINRVSVPSEFHDRTYDVLIPYCPICGSRVQWVRVKFGDRNPPLI